MSPPRPARKGRLSLVALVLVPLLVVGVWLALREEDSGSRFDEALDRALAPVLEEHAEAMRLGAGTTTQARLMAREAAANSLQFLAPADLELWSTTRLNVARSSPHTCAKLWQGGDAAFVGRAVAELGDEELDAYTGMLARGLSLRLERKPPPEPPPGAIERGTRAIADALPAAEGSAFLVDIGRTDLSEARACQLFLQLSTGAQKLPPDERVAFLRALAKELPVTKN